MNPCEHEVLRFSACDRKALTTLLGRYGLALELIPDGAPIPGSYWGDEEAGLLGGRLLARGDTPVHSVLHESCHFICMDPGRRATLHTDASGDYDEENAVCYLQILLADTMPGMGRERMFRDMDTWGYSFRLGSAREWFENDAADARRWLLERELISTTDEPTYLVRKL